MQLDVLAEAGYLDDPDGFGRLLALAGPLAHALPAGRGVDIGRGEVKASEGCDRLPLHVGLILKKNQKS